MLHEAAVIKRSCSPVASYWGGGAVIKSVPVSYSTLPLFSALYMAYREGNY